VAANRQIKHLEVSRIDMMRNLRLAAGMVLAAATALAGPLLLTRGVTAGDSQPAPKKVDEVRTVMLPPPAPPPVPREERAASPEVRAPKPEQELVFSGLDRPSDASPKRPMVVQTVMAPKARMPEAATSALVELPEPGASQVFEAREPEAPAAEASRTRVGADHTGSDTKPGGTTGQKPDGGVTLPAIEVEDLDEQAVRRLVEARVALLIGTVDGRFFCWDGGGWKVATRDSLPFAVTDLGPTLRPEAVQGIVRGLKEISSGVPRLELRLAQRPASALRRAVMSHLDQLGLGSEAWRDVPGLVVAVQALSSGEFKVVGHRGFEVGGTAP